MGQQVTDEFDRYNDELGHYNWYLLPYKFQKMIVVLTINAQKPTIIRGYGNMRCVRYEFKDVSFNLLHRQSTKNILNYRMNIILYPNRLTNAWNPT